MRSHFYKPPTWVILSGAKDLTQALLITLRERRDTTSVHEVSRLVRDDPRSTRHRVLFTTCP